MKSRIIERTPEWRSFFMSQLYYIGITLILLSFFGDAPSFATESATPRRPIVDAAKNNVPGSDETLGRELSWEMPGRLSIYDLQFGPAITHQNKWKFLGNSRTFNAGLFGDRLTLIVRFSYRATAPDTPLKFVIKLPESRQYEETVRLANRQGQFDYHFTIHKPEDFLGSGMIYLYYGFSIVDVLDFTIMPGS
ncbi:MAG: hypothetical protein ACP5VS_05495 [Desulfomonilaceae bacterium]